MKINKFESRDSLFDSIAKKIQFNLSEAIYKNNTASFIVPGGTTPAPVFEILSRSDLDWNKVTIAQSDERWLQATHEQSNERLTRENLLINHAKTANYVSMKNEAVNIKEGELVCDTAYQTITSPFTICMLGMGLDGHIASLFPDSKNIRKALSLENNNLCIAIDASGCSVAGDYPMRMSLTLSAILNSETILLLITGKEKLKIIENLINTSPDNNLPVSHIINQSTTNVEVFWCD
ncbi:MAG: 6-phosphogluconolactonase [Kangiella sp.]|nr:MAG: 6-phosphogluconolactonase [Kangiella sp.]